MNEEAKAQEILQKIQTTEATSLSAQTIEQYKEILNKIKTEAQALLSAIDIEPITPYEKLKRQYFDADYKFPTFNDLPEPEDFDLDNINCCLSAITEKVNESCTMQLSCLSASQETSPHFGQAFTQLSGNNLTINNEACKEYMIFTEIVKSIPVDLIYIQPEAVAKKLLTQYSKLLAKL